MKLVTFTIKKYFPGEQPLGDFGDVFQIGSIGLCKAAQTYDPNKGFTFATYAVRCIRSEILLALRETRAQVRATDKEKLSLDELYGEDESYTILDILPDPTADTEGQLEARERLKDAMRYFEGQPILFAVATRQMTQHEAADLLGVTQPTVYRRLKAILDQMKEDDHG